MTNKGLTQHPIHGTYKNPWTVSDSIFIQSDLIPVHCIEIATMTTTFETGTGRGYRKRISNTAVQRINNSEWQRCSECSAINVNEIKENTIKHYLGVDPSRYIA